MTTKKYHKKEFGLLKVEDLAHKSKEEIKSIINKQSQSHSDIYLLTMPINPRDRAVASSSMSAQLTTKLRTRNYERDKNIFESELEKEVKNVISDLNNTVNRYYNSKTFRDERVFSPDIYKIRDEIENIHNMIQNIVQLDKELEEKTKTLLNL